MATINIQTSPKLEDIAVFSRCHFTRAYRQPVAKKENCIRSYSHLSIQALETGEENKFLATDKNGNKYIDSNAKRAYERRYFDVGFLDKNGFKYGISQQQIAILTGEYFIDPVFGFLANPQTKTPDTTRPYAWLRARLLYCNKANYGWLRSSDVAPDVSAEVFPVTAPEKKILNNKWLWWLIAGLTALR